MLVMGFEYIEIGYVEWFGKQVQEGVVIIMAGCVFEDVIGDVEVLVIVVLVFIWCVFILFWLVFVYLWGFCGRWNVDF